MLGTGKKRRELGNVESKRGRVIAVLVNFIRNDRRKHEWLFLNQNFWSLAVHGE